MCGSIFLSIVSLEVFPHLGRMMRKKRVRGRGGDGYVFVVYVYYYLYVDGG